MTDKQYAAQKKRVQKYIDKWFKPMGLDWYHVTMIWSRERDEDEPQTAARVVTRWQYRSASITWYLPAIVDNDEDFLEGIIVHEFTHILVAPLLAVSDESELPNHHEYATECVARAIRWVREADKK